jgi:sugar phosphate permease
MLAIESSSANKPAKKRIHYGFIIILAGFLTQFVLLCAQRMPALTLEPIRQTLGINYTEIGLITSWFTVFYAGSAFIWGYLNDALGAKKTLGLASLITSAGLIVFGLFAQAGLLVAIILWSIAGLGCAGLYMATLPKIIGAWFVPNKRGFAMGLITPGGNICSIVLGLLVPTLVVNTSWQTGFIAVGAFCLLVTVFIFAFVKSSPWEKGLAPYGSPPGTQAAPPPKAENAEKGGLGNYVAVLKKPITWHFGLMHVIYQIGYMISTAYYVASTQYAGYSLVEAGLGITFGGIVTVFFLNLWGNLSDRIERKYVLSISMLGSAIVALGYFLALQGSPALWLCWFFVAFLTGFNGNQSAMLAAAGDYYEPEMRGTGTGIISTMSIIGRYSGPLIAGIVIDAASGNVGMAFVAIAIAMLVGAIGFLTLPKLRTGRIKVQ